MIRSDDCSFYIQKKLRRRLYNGSERKICKGTESNGASEKGKCQARYPVRKSVQTEFAHVGGKEGLQFQVDAVAYCGK